jgi:hypothetical protein
MILPSYRATIQRIGRANRAPLGSHRIERPNESPSMIRGSASLSRTAAGRHASALTTAA